MHKFIHLFLFLLPLFAHSAYAGSSHIKWVGVDDYHDLKSGDNLKDNTFKTRFFKAIESEVEKLAMEKLSPEQAVVLAIRNVDLAGTLTLVNHYGSQKMIRTFGQETPASISIGYIVIEKSGKEIASGAEVIIENNFRFKTTRADNFYHERKLIRDWLSNEFDVNLN